MRDSSNMSPQSATLTLDKTSYFPGENVEITVEEEDSKFLILSLTKKICE